MSKSSVFTNTFVGGMLQTIDLHEQPNSTYRFSSGGRINYNRTTKTTESLDENVRDGRSRAFTNALGNTISFVICPGYKVIGAIESSKGVVIFSTNEQNSEIGFLVANDNIYRNGYAQYATLYNDRLDPNGDKLQFNIDKYIHGYTVYENQFTERIHFVDNYNQKRVINLPLFYKEDGTTYHNPVESCTSTAEYPKWLSVHAFDDRMDVKLPKMKFNKRIKGTLKSGQYQLMVQYVSTNGHKSVWLVASRAVWVTDQKLDGDIAIAGVNYPNAYKSNHHNRTMGPSNVMTEEGQRWKIQHLDTRWNKLNVGYIYHESSDTFQEANVFKTYDITAAELIVDLNSHTGTPVTKDELNQRFETILKVGTTAQQENRSWIGNLELIPEINPDLSAVKIEPIARYYRPDVTIEPVFTQVFNPVSGRDDNDPFTNTFPTTQDIQIQNFENDFETYNLEDDYLNYKGQLFNFLYKGYFRGETYPFGLLWIDRKGNPLFVQNIGDFTFPNQFDTEDANGNPTDWTLSRQNTDGSFDLRIMGAKISNIIVPASILYDKFGKLNISGFMIVRSERIGRIANQGLMFNCNISANGETDDENDGWVHPMEGYENWYNLKAGGGYPNAHVYNGLMGSMYNREEDPNQPFPSFSAATFFDYYSPDITIEQAIGNKKNPNAKMLGGQMQKVGFVHSAYSMAKNIGSDHYYSKQLRTNLLDWPLERDYIKNSRAALKSKSRIKMAMLHDQPATFTYEKFDPETSDLFDYRANVQAFFNGQEYAWKSSQQPYSVIMKLYDWKLIDSMESMEKRVTYPIVNWLVTPDTYYSGDTSTADDATFQTRRYFSTGHIQRIDNEILDIIPKTYKPDGSVENFIFNEIEVWGGDCYNVLWDFTRMYPYYLNCKKSDGVYPDYSNSIICPIETKYNLSLLYGRKFAANAVMPQRVSCTTENERFSNGIMLKQPEDWSYNEVLLLEENTQFFFQKPDDIKIVQYQPTSIRWTPKKIYGELEDSYRQYLVDDYSDVIGEFGPIMRFCSGFDYLYVLQEKGFGGLLTKLDRFIPSDTGDLVVKSGDAFSGVRYISKTFGTQHVNSVWQFDNNIGWVDARMGKIIVFSQAGLDKASESDNMDDLIMETSIYFDRYISHSNVSYIDIVAGYDIENGEALTTFLYGFTSNNQPSNPQNRENEFKSFTIVYNKLAGVFHGYQPFTPRIYFNSGRFLFAPHPEIGKENEIYLFGHGLYGQFYDTFYPTILEVIVNPQPNVSKTFDNAFLNIDEDSWKRISRIIARVNRNIHTLDLAIKTVTSIVFPDDRAEYEEDVYKFPLHEIDDLMEKTRLRGNYMVLRLIIDNSQQEIDNQNIQVSITNIDTKFRISSPVQY